MVKLFLPHNSGQPLTPPGFYIVRTAEIDAVSQADIVSARRHQAVVHAVMAKIALAGHRAIRIKSDGFERTFIHAGPAAVAQLLSQHDNAVFPLYNGCLAACVQTWRVITVAAQIDLKSELRPPIRGFGYLFINGNELGGPIQVKLLHTGRFAGSASPAGIFIDDKFVGFHSSIRFSG
jgi:hypothetical protein